MERTLSNLQIEILKMACENGHGGVTNPEVLEKVYKFPVTGMGKMRFDRANIGFKRYQSASSAVARSFNRLAEGGLAEREFNYGVKLTEAGWRVAQELVG